MNEAQGNYTTVEKEMLAVVYSCDKYRVYIIGLKVVVFTDHAAIRYLLEKKDANLISLGGYFSCKNSIWRSVISVG